jgi:hypothetical protein
MRPFVQEVEVSDMPDESVLDQKVSKGYLLDLREAAQYLTQRTEIGIDVATLSRLKSSGRGPVTLRAGSGHLLWEARELDRWASFVLGSRDDQPEPYYPVPSHDSCGGLTWLQVGPCSPDTEYLRDHLIAWGANVLGPVDLIRTAAVFADQADLTAAMIEMDSNIEAAMLLTGILQRRRIPYVMITALDEFPRSLGAEGLVVRHSIDEIRFAMETRLPARAVAGMNFAVDTSSITWG